MPVFCFPHWFLAIRYVQYTLTLFNGYARQPVKWAHGVSCWSENRS